VTITASDESPQPAGDELAWSDVWHLDAATDDGIGLTVRLECYPNRGVAWFWAYLVRPDLDGTVVVRDHDVPLPRQGLEVRTEGLWAELWCETPLEHWTYGLEAFGVRVEDLDVGADASSMLGVEIGERVALGLDLEWEIAARPYPHGAGWSRRGYVVPGIVHGEVLLGRSRFELDARGEYHRSWGAREWEAGAWAFGCAAPDAALHVEGHADGTVDGCRWRGGEDGVAVTAVRAEVRLPSSARLVLADETEVDVEGLAGAPVPLGNQLVAQRALCRYTFGDTTAHGWATSVEQK
jgi:hypothetical protein